MKLDNVISVSGLPGLHKLIATRPNGLLIESFDNGKRQFVSVRKHQFTPLVSIGIYTYTDVAGIDDVLMKIDSTQAENPVPDVNDKADNLRAWFKTIVADHDEDRVHINDIRKVIKWYTFLKLYAWEMVTADSATESVAEVVEEVKEEEKES
jgi:tRNA-dihydrouridine synthase